MTKSQKSQYRAWEGNDLYNTLCKFFPRYYTAGKKLNVGDMAFDLGWSPLRIYRALRGTTLAPSTMGGLLVLCAHYVNANLLFERGMRPEDLKPQLQKHFTEGF